MVVGTLEVSLRIEGCRSLKEKRSVVKPILEKSRRRFGVSAAEVGDNDLWNSAELGFAVVSPDAVEADRVLKRVLEFVETTSDAVVVGARIEMG